MVHHTALLTLPVFLSLSTATARIHHSRGEHASHDHAVSRSLPKRWFHTEDSHPVHKLFNRQEDKTDGQTYAAVGSPEWTALFPPEIPDASQMPQEWKDALKAAEDAGLIPDIPVTTLDANGGQPTYPAGIDPAGDEVCNWGYECKHPDDIWNGLDGYFAVNFDDGPHEGSAKLYDFLAAHETPIPTTHFVVGRHIRNLPDLYTRAVEELNADIAVHTYTHRQLTALSNEDVMAELAWTMEIIHKSTGGRLPKFWRPPTGDADNRIRAIAKGVLGMDMVMWNQDTRDWSIALGQTTESAVAAELKTWAEGPKSPGLIVLEHESSNTSVQLFQDAVPLIEAAGWKWASVAQITEGRVDEFGAYSNVDGEGNVAVGVVGEPVEEAADSGNTDAGTGTGATGGDKGPSTPGTAKPPTGSGSPANSGNNDLADNSEAEGAAFSVAVSVRYLIAAFAAVLVL
ncbi:hypothetical protein BDV98DRAFT_594340 [Pterulicium gracile]|uniref:chitin deacetylase n=1 Tax=Pterulicium gracile TaxID=1884261 RepID=A0A5C3QG02_9AGAR|nr:hypothetical protein BDV98DRAFT_594340 [Pterula gracilis]